MEEKLHINERINCLDHGFIRLVDYMGDDSAIVQAARVSYGKGTKSYREDRGLIRYLMRQGHTSPFEMVEFKFDVRLPIFVARQWIRHRTANVNEYSGRYSEMVEECYLPEAGQLCPQAENNRQGREDEPLDDKTASTILSNMQESQKKAFVKYRNYIDLGLARELSRINLPLSTYTEWYWKIDLHNLFHFLKLRFDSHAQYEIRVYAEAMAKIVKEIVPIAYEAFEDYYLGAVKFSATEIKILRNIIDVSKLDPEKLTASGLSKREASAFIDTLTSVNN